MLEFSDLILYKVVVRDCLSCVSLLALGPLFPQQHMPRHCQRSGLKTEDARESLDTMLRKQNFKSQ